MRRERRFNVLFGVKVRDHVKSFVSAPHFWGGKEGFHEQWFSVFDPSGNWRQILLTPERCIVLPILQLQAENSLSVLKEKMIGSFLVWTTWMESRPERSLPSRNNSLLLSLHTNIIYFCCISSNMIHLGDPGCVLPRTDEFFLTRSSLGC